MKQKVFGIGLNKTGTSTLGECMIALGYRHLCCRRDLLIALRNGDFETIFNEIEKYDSFEDWPYPLMYREIFERYPTARFILTTRIDAATWLESLKAHSLRTSVAEQCRTLAYGRAYPFGFEAEHTAFYEKHNADVVSFFRQRGASDRLLPVCWERGHGWTELCEFLGEKRPDKPFPHANAGTRQPAPMTRFLQNRALAFAKSLAR